MKSISKGSYITAQLMAEKATEFITVLDDSSQDILKFDFDSLSREDWHYVPRARVGLPRKQMDERELAAAHSLMACGLSTIGVNKAEQIIKHELILGQIEGSSAQFLRDPGLYFFNIFGDPFDNSPWGWRVEGHHLSLNYTLANGNLLSTTPSFFGANPAEVKEGPAKGLRILESEEEIGRQLLLSLDQSQRNQAVLYEEAPRDLITRADRRVAMGKPAGLTAASMTSDQREKLVSLIKVYLDKNTEEIANRLIREIERNGIEKLSFGWAGGERPGDPHYYRLHGPSLFVEYDNVQDGANHVHSVWRDIEGDFGRDILLEHYKNHHV